MKKKTLHLMLFSLLMTAQVAFSQITLTWPPASNPYTSNISLGTGNNLFTVDIPTNITGSISGGIGSTLTKSGLGLLELTGTNTGILDTFYLNSGILSISNRNNLINEMRHFRFNSSIADVITTDPSTQDLQLLLQNLKSAINNYTITPSTANKLLVDNTLLDYNTAVATAQANGSLGTLQINSTMSFDGLNSDLEKLTIDSLKAGSIHLINNGTNLNFINGLITDAILPTGYGSVIFNYPNSVLALTADNNTRFIFANNTATNGGHGSVSNRGGYFSINNADFHDNTAEGAGPALLSNGLTILKNITFADNNSTNLAGGAIYNYSGAHDGTLFMDSITFLRNHANTAAGGALYNGENSPMLVGRNIVFRYNTANGGGGLRNNLGNMVLENFVFDSNVVASGGGAVMTNTLATFIDGSFINNIAGAQGGAIATEGGILNLQATGSNTLLFSGNINMPAQEANSIYAGALDNLNIIADANAVVDMLDPMNGAANFMVTKSGMGTWKLGGETQFTGNVTFNVDEGQLYLYKADEIANANPVNPSAMVSAGKVTLSGASSSFNVASGAELTAHDSTSITANTINFNNGSAISFANTAAQEMLTLNGTTTLDGTSINLSLGDKIVVNGNVNFTANPIIINIDQYHVGTFELLRANNNFTVSDLSNFQIAGNPDSISLMVNPMDNNSILFTTPAGIELANLPTGDIACAMQPFDVIIHANGLAGLVSNKITHFNNPNLAKAIYLEYWTGNLPPAAPIYENLNFLDRPIHSRPGEYIAWHYPTALSEYPPIGFPLSSLPPSMKVKSTNFAINEDVTFSMSIVDSTAQGSGDGPEGNYNYDTVFATSPEYTIHLNNLGNTTAALNNFPSLINCTLQDFNISTTLDNTTSCDTLLVRPKFVFTENVFDKIMMRWDKGGGMYDTLTFINPTTAYLGDTINGVALTAGGFNFQITSTSIDSLDSFNYTASITSVLTGEEVIPLTNNTGSTLTKGLPFAGILAGVDSTCENVSTLFTSTVLGGNWEIGSGSGSVINGLVLGTNQGLLNIRYIIENEFGCRDTAQANITIQASPVTSDITNLTSATVCSGNTATLYATPASTDFVPLWYSDAALTNLVFTGDTLTIPSVLSDTTFYVVAQNTLTGCIADSAEAQTASVTVNPIPVLSISNHTDSVCSTTPTAVIVLSSYGITSSGGANDSIIYSMDNSFASLLDPAMVTVNTGNNVIFVKAFDKTTLCESAYDSISYMLNLTPQFAYADTTTCGMPIDLAMLPLASGDVTGLTLTYFNADYSLDLTSNTMVDTSGIYHIIGTNASGCSDTADINVTINNVPMLSFVNRADSVCSTTPTAVIDLTSYGITSSGGANDSIVYSMDNSFASLIDPMMVNVNTGNNVIFVKAFDKTTLCKSAYDSIMYMLNATPQFAYADTTTCGMPIDLAMLPLTSGDITGLTLTYFNADYSLDLTGNTMVDTSGIYHIIGTNASGCSDTADVNVTINIVPMLSFVNRADSVCSTTPTAVINLTSYGVTSSGGANDSIIYSMDNTFASLIDPMMVTVNTGNNVVFVKAFDKTTLCESAYDSISYMLNLTPQFAYADTTTCGMTIDLAMLPLTSGNVTGLILTYFNSDYSLNLTSNTMVDTSGIYHIIGTNASGCSDTADVNVTINIVPMLSFVNRVDSVCSTTPTAVINLSSFGVTSSGGANDSIIYSLDNMFASLIDPMMVNVNAGLNTIFIKSFDKVTLCESAYDSISYMLDLTPQFAYADTTTCGMLIDLAMLPLTSGDVTGLTLTYFNSDYSTDLTSNTVVSTSGIYHIIGTNINGCSDTADVNVTINIVPMLSFVNRVDSVCSITPTAVIDLTSYGITSSGGANDSIIYSMDNSFASLLDPAMVTVNTGNNVIFVKAFDKTTLCESAYDSISYMLNATPQFAFADTTTCGMPIDLAMLPLISGDITGLTLTYFNADYSLNLTSNTMVDTSGIYHIIGTNINGCSDTADVNVTINILPTVASTKISDSICASTAQTIDLISIFGLSTANGGDTLLFASDSLFTTPISNPNAYLANIGSNIIYAQAQSSTTTCVSLPLVLTYNVNDLPTVTVIVPGKDTITCSSSPVAFDLSDMAVPGNGGDSLEFSETPDFTSIIPDPANYVVNLNDTVVVYIRALNTTTTCTGTNIDSVTLAVGVTPTITTQPISIVYGSGNLLSVIVNGIAPKFQWFKNGVLLTHDTNSTVAPSGVGKYYVTITDQCGNANSDTTDVLKALLTVTVADDSVDVGFDPLAYTGHYTITGYVNGEDSTALTSMPVVSIAFGIGSTTPSGVYPDTIIASGGEAANYDFIYSYGDLSILSVNTGITDITMNGDSIPRVNDSTFAMMVDCGADDVTINVTADPNATVKINNVVGNPYTYTLPKYGENDITVEIIAQNGTSQTYTIKANKPIPADKIFIQRWSDVLTIPAEFEGIPCNKVEWYFTDMQGNTTKLDRDVLKGYLQTKQGGFYHVVINDTLTTCSVEAIAQRAPMQVFPNPVNQGNLITVETYLSDEELKDATLNIMDIQGKLWSTQAVSSARMQIASPTSPGTYVVRINTLNNSKQIKIIVVNN